MREVEFFGVVEVSAVDFDFGRSADLSAGRKNGVEARDWELGERGEQREEKKEERAHPSVVEQKFFCVQESPDDVFVGDAFGGGEFFGGDAGGFLLDVFDAGFDFGGGGFAGEGEEIKFADFVVVGAGVFGEEGRAAGVSGEFVLNFLGVNEVQGLRETGFL